MPLQSASARYGAHEGDRTPPATGRQPVALPRVRRAQIGRGAGARTLIDRLRADYSPSELHPHWYSRPVPPRDLSVIGRLLSAV